MDFPQQPVTVATGFSTTMAVRNGSSFPETYTNSRDTYRLNVVGDRWISYASETRSGANVMFTPDELAPYCVCSMIEDAYANGALNGKGKK